MVRPVYLVIIAMGLVTYYSLLFNLESLTNPSYQIINSPDYFECLNAGALVLVASMIGEYLFESELRQPSYVWEMGSISNKPQTQTAKPLAITGSHGSCPSHPEENFATYAPKQDSSSRIPLKSPEPSRKFKTDAQSLIERSPLIIYSYSLTKGGRYYSPQVETYFGYSPAYLYDHPHHLYQSIHPDDIAQVEEALMAVREGDLYQLEYRIRHANGDWIWVSDSCLSIYHEGEDTIIEGMATDITSRKILEEKLQYQAIHDSLTHLPTRVALMEHLDRFLLNNRNHHTPNYQCALLLVDLDEFKLINDSLGHLYGDKLLVQVAHRIQAVVDGADLVVRLGGDEFMVLLECLTNEDDAIRMAQNLLTSIREPITIEDKVFHVTASIGIALGDESYQNSDEIVRDADNAMYRAKEQGRDRWCQFDPEMHIQSNIILKIRTSFRTGLEENQFKMYYQPIVAIQDQSLVGFEALVRWCHPKLGIVPPFQFIPLAEESGFIGELGHWIFWESCRQFQAWQEQFPNARTLKVSVNLSGFQLKQDDLLTRMDSVLWEVGFDPHCLKLEVTESVLMEDYNRTQALFQAWHERGIEICIDDFGTGYSSLSYLHKLPFDVLKIDKSFIQSDLQDRRFKTLIKTIIDVAHNFDMAVIAEGIETPAQLAVLNQFGCELGQGYLFDKPLPAEQVPPLFLMG